MKRQTALVLCSAVFFAGAMRAQVYGDGSGIVSMEAERATVVNRSGKQWAPSTNSWGYSGNGFLLPSPVWGTAYPNYVGVAPEAQFQVNFTTAGRFFVWVRGAGGSAHVGLDGAAVASASQITGLTSNWSWTNLRADGSRASVYVNAPGTHTVNVWMAADSFWFDKIMLTQWSGYVPGGTGPAETVVASGGSAPAPAPAPVPSGTGSAAAGSVALMKLAGSAYNLYSLYPSSWLQQFQLAHIQRMVGFYPSYNSATWWYPNGLMYVDTYAVYPGGTFGENLLATHPDWILKNSGGANLYIPFACGGGTCPEYAGDFSNPAFRNWWISKVRAQLASGNYKGIFMDDVNFDWRVSDGWGKTVIPWDRNTNAPMTLDNWRRYMAEFLEAIRWALPGYEICHNAIWFAGGDSGRDSNPYIQRQIAASDEVHIEFGVNDGGLTGGTGIWSVDAVLAYIDRVHAKGRRVVVGGLASGNAWDKVALEFGVAGYFLVNNGGDYASDAYDSLVIDPNNWWPGFDVNLGQATGSRYWWNGFIRRDFTGGMVLMNYPGSPTVSMALPGSFRRIDGSVVNWISLGARQGAILRY